MKKLIGVVSVVAAALAGVLVPSNPALAAACSNAGSYAGGDGQIGTPYQISTPGQFQYLTSSMNAGANTAGKYFEITADLDFGGCSFTRSAGGYPFKGSLDGGNHTISDLVISETSYAAIFGQAKGAVIKNLTVDQVEVTGQSYTGVLVGLVDAESGTPTILDNITISNSTVLGDSYTGGLAGAAFNGSGDSLNKLRVVSTSVGAPGLVGGLFGGVSGYPSIDQSGFFGGSVNRTSLASSSLRIGGLLGIAMGNIAFTQVGFRGKVDVSGGTTSRVGFVVGDGDNKTITITDSYVQGTGAVANGGTMAGMVGANSVAVAVTKSYVQVSVLDRNGSEAEISQFAAGGQNLTGAFYHSELHTNWVSDIASAAKTDAELLNSGTHGAAGWNSTADEAAITAGTDSATWYFSNFNGGAKIGGGYFLLTWEYLGLTLTPCQAGQTSYNGIGPCDPVPVGHYIEFTGSFDYKPCPIGYFQENAGGTGCDPAPAGKYVATTGQSAATSCPAGTYQPNQAQMVCLWADPGYFVASDGSAAQTICPAGTTSLAQATSCYAISFTYDGPMLDPISQSASPGEAVTLTGKRMNTITTVEMDGLSAVAECTESTCSFTVPADVSAGDKNLVLIGSHGKLTVQGALAISDSPAGSFETVASWTKNQGDGTVKLYAMNIVGAGKVQFMFNGEEIAWVRALDDSDPKLRNANGAQYLVRTVELVRGQKNVLEIYVDGVRTKRAAYTG